MIRRNIPHANLPLHRTLIINYAAFTRWGAILRNSLALYIGAVALPKLANQVTANQTNTGKGQRQKQPSTKNKPHSHASTQCGFLMNENQGADGDKTQQGQQHLVVNFPKAIAFDIAERKSRNDPDSQNPCRPFQKTDQHIFAIA